MRRRGVLALGAAFCGAALAGAAGFVSFAPQNLWQEALSLHKEAAANVPIGQRQAEAKEVLEQVFQTYRSLASISFTAEEWMYWCDRGSWRSRLPFRFWPKRYVGRAELQQVGDLRKLVIGAQGCDDLLTIYLSPTERLEHQRAWKDHEERTIVYASSLDDRDGFRLAEFLEPWEHCALNWFTRPFVGEHSRLGWQWQPTWRNGPYKGQPVKDLTMESLGKSALARGTSVLWSGPPSPVRYSRFDVLYIDDANLAAIWLIADDLSYDPEEKHDMMFRVLQFSDYRTGPISIDQVTPPAALRAKALRHEKVRAICTTEPSPVSAPTEDPIEDVSTIERRSP